MDEFERSFSLLPDREDRLLFAAAGADSLTALVELAGRELGASVIAADSLHTVLAVSEDVGAACSAQPSWTELVAAGYVPELAGDHESRGPADHPAAELVGQSLLFHGAFLPDGRSSTMCDILENGTILMKLAVTSARPLDTRDKKYLLTVANGMHLCYLRLRSASETDRRGLFLLRLLHDAKAPELPYAALPGFPCEGPFELICLETRHLQQNSLDFLTLRPQMTNCLAVQDGMFYYILLHAGSDDFLNHLDELSGKRDFPVLRSPSFSDLRETREQGVELRQLAALAGRFRGGGGLHGSAEYRLFSMLEQMCGQNFRPHADAQTLAAHDREKNSDYAGTIYCWLLHHQMAPATARALFIRRNTLDKRLRKIETLIRPEWNQTAYDIELLASLYVLLRDEGKLTFYREDLG